MGRNRQWVLEDSSQDAEWKTILRGSRPPSVRWEKPRKQSATVTHQPGAKRNSSSVNRSEEEDPPQVAPPTTGVHHTGRSTGCSPPASWEIGSNSHNVGGRRRDCCSHPGCLDESPAGTGTAIPGTCRVHKDVRGEAAEEGRTGPCECRQGQGGSGRSSGLPGEGKIFVGRWGREVVAVACRSETSPFTLHRSTSASRPRHPRRDATYAACHRRIATRVDTIEMFSCLSSGGCDSQGRRRDGSRWEFSYVAQRPRLALCGGGALDGSPS